MSGFDFNATNLLLEAAATGRYSNGVMFAVNFAWSVLGQNDYRVAKSRFHDVNEPTEPQWSMSLFKSNRLTDTVKRPYPWSSMVAPLCAGVMIYLHQHRH